MVLSLAGAIGLATAAFYLVGDKGAWSWVSAGLGLALAGLAQGLRFRAPINAALFVGGLAAGLSGLFQLALSVTLPLSVHVVIGLAILVLAVSLDASDPQRQGLRADAAFWLHLLAAPWLVHSLFLHFSQAETGAVQTTAMLGIYLLLGLVSLVLDRRAMLLAGLSYVLVALSDLLGRGSHANAVPFAVAALIVGAALVLIAARWQAARRPLLRRLPARWQQLLPPIPG